MVLRNGLAQTMPARALRVGDEVQTTLGVEVLIDVQTQEAALVEIVEIQFEPDLPVEAFHSTILSKGLGWPKTRRGHGNRRCHDSDEVLSIPCTETSLQ